MADVRLELKVTAPDLTDVDEKYSIIYSVENQGDMTFPGGTINCSLYWSAIERATHVNHPLEIPELPPWTTIALPLNHVDRVSGMTYIAYN